MAYVDGFVIAVPNANRAAYEAMARLGGQVWKEHGALAYVECWGDDTPFGDVTSFPRSVQAKEDETVVFSWIVYESREARDAICAKVMADERLKDSMENAPFDARRMIYGGFQVLIQM